MNRKPAVAGQFYSASPEQLRCDISAMLPPVETKRNVLGVVAPHAGYVYSGAVAGILYAGITIPKTVLILGPNHHGIGAPLALYPEGAWQSPLGLSPVNDALNKQLLATVPYLQPDTTAHSREHSLEVHLPFLQQLQPELTISAICVGHCSDSAVIEQIGSGIARALQVYAEPVLIVASSDMTHYESADSARNKDSLAIEALLQRDPEALLSVCKVKRITMCGVVPAAIMLAACNALGATRSELVSYRTSGDVTGDSSQVVGYASVAVW